MSLGIRDLEALELVRARTFDASFVASFDLEMQARRITLRFYGTLRSGDTGTYVGTITFFGASDVRFDNPAGAFPDSARVAGFTVAYDDEADCGNAEIRGGEHWALRWVFDGLAYEERPAVLASLADER